MGNIFNTDFIDFINAFNKADVEYMLVGGYAVNLYGYRRSTGDMDIWVNPTLNNYERMKTAFRNFGLPIQSISEEKFLSTSSNEYDVFTFGVSPVAIDIMTICKGLNFEEAYIKSQIIEHDQMSIRIIHINDLITAKKASGRNRDIDDIEHLEKY